MLKMHKDGIDRLLAHHTREAQHARGAAVNARQAEEAYNNRASEHQRTVVALQDLLELHDMYAALDRKAKRDWSVCDGQ